MRTGSPQGMAPMLPGRSRSRRGGHVADEGGGKEGGGGPLRRILGARDPSGDAGGG